MVEQSIPSSIVPLIVAMIGKTPGHWRDSAWRLLFNDCSLDAIEFLAPKIAVYIDKNVPPLNIPVPIYGFAAVSDIDSRIPDAIWKFKALNPEEQDIIFYLEQQHNDVPDFALRINQISFRLMDSYPNDIVIGFAIYTGENNKIYNIYNRVKGDLGFFGKFGSYILKTAKVDELKQDKSFFATAILAAKYMEISNGIPAEREKYGIELLNTIYTNINLDNNRKLAYGLFVCRILRLYDNDISIKLQERWLMTTIFTASDVFAGGKIEGQIEGQAICFLDMLPHQFEFIKIRPSYKSELIEIGARNGVNKEIIEAEYAEWLNKQNKKS
jgi:hypothetical protein